MEVLEKIVSGHDEGGTKMPTNKEIATLLRLDNTQVVAWFAAHGKTLTSAHELYLAAEEGGELWELKAPRFKRNLDERTKDSESRKANKAQRKKQRAEKKDTLSLLQDSSDDESDEQAVEILLSARSIDELKRMLTEHQEKTAKKTASLVRLIHAKTLQDVQCKADEAFECPILKTRMKDPVCTSDGHTYERAAIELWFRNHATSPSTGLQLSNKMLTPNHLLRSMIQNAGLVRPASS